MKKSLKIKVNGKNEVIAGVDDAIQITSVTDYFPEYNKCNHRVYALRKSNSGEITYAEWSCFMKKEINDITIKVTNDEIPDPIVRERPEFTTWDPEGKLLNVCSFCGKNEDDVKNIISGPGVCICNECVEIASEAIT